MKATIHPFAVLKDFLGPEVSLELETGQSVKDVLSILRSNYPAASDVLNTCRVAIHEEFVSQDVQVADNEHIYILPPSSGG